MKRYNIAYALLIIAIGVFAAWYAMRYRSSDTSPKRNSDAIYIRTGTDTFPTMMSVGLVASGAVILIGAVRGKVTPGEETIEPFGVSRLVPFVIAFAAYFVLLRPLGFLVDSTLMVAFCMHRLGCRNWIAMTAYSILMPFAVFAVFYYLMYVSLPLGILEPILPKY